ncbi:hypothetical protein [Streptomyces sp. NPDC056817]|uniref:hypothetical protein n=1 Tax=Streptomyces sp. NPDC056817 TaxID=3345950 RepID=UPI0036CE0934
MDRYAAAGLLIDAVLTVGLAACTITAAAAAAIPLILGYRTGTWAAIRWHGRRITRDAETYLRYPELRPVIDHHDQPREEL